MILFAQEPCSPSQAAPRLGGRRSIYPTLHHTVCFFHSSVCSVLLSFTKFCAVNDLDLCFFGRSKLFQSLSLGQPCVAQCPWLIGAKGLGERHCCHFDQISTNQPNRHHITSHRIVQCRRLRRGRGQLSVLSHDLRLGSAGHQVLLFLFRLISQHLQ